MFDFNKWGFKWNDMISCTYFRKKSLELFQFKDEETEKIENPCAGGTYTQIFMEYRTWYFSMNLKQENFLHGEHMPKIV